MSALESRLATALQRLFSIDDAEPRSDDRRFALESPETDGPTGTRAAVDVDGSTADEPGDSRTGRRTVVTDGGRSPQDQLSDDRTDDVDAVTVEFLDRETVRITGNLEDVLCSLFWWDESGLVGTITEPIGGVDGERVVTASEAFGDQTFAHGPIVSGVEGFATAGPSVPGTGDVSAPNPDVEAHVEAVREEYDGPGDLEEPFPDAS